MSDRVRKFDDLRQYVADAAWERMKLWRSVNRERGGHAGPQQLFTNTRKDCDVFAGENGIGQDEAWDEMSEIYLGLPPDWVDPDEWRLNKV